MRISAGMRQRLAIARSLLAGNDLLLLDEPTIKLDPDGARDIRSFIRETNQFHGVTVLLTTHQMYEAEELCHRILVMHRGRIVQQGTTSQIKRAAGILGTAQLILSDAPPSLGNALDQCDSVRSFSINQQHCRLELSTEDVDTATEDVLGISHRLGIQVRSMRSQEPSLADAFHSLTGESLSDEPGNADARRSDQGAADEA